MLALPAGMAGDGDSIAGPALALPAGRPVRRSHATGAVLDIGGGGLLA